MVIDMSPGVSEAPLKMVVSFGSQTRVKCLKCKKFIPNAKFTSCPRCLVNYQQVDDNHYVATGDA